jgi:hypothetical protein
MAQAKAAKKTAHKTTRAAKKGPHKTSVSADKAKLKASLKKTIVASDEDEEEDLEWGEVKKPGAKKKTGKKYAKLDLKPIKMPAKTVGKGKKARKVKPKKLSASQVLNLLVEETGMARKDVRLVLETLSNTVKAAIMPGAIGGVVVPGVGAVMRKVIKAKKVDAIPRGTVVEKRNPRTGEVTKFKHPGQKAYVKPERMKVRTIPLSSVRRALNGTE